MTVTTDEYLKDLRRVFTEEGRCSYFIYRLAGSYSATSVLKRFDTWNHALTQAGVPLSKLGRPRTRKTLDTARVTR